ncbi:ProQ/FINO family protein [Halomonas sp. LS-001]
MQLLDDLEAKIERAQRLINVLEAQNRQLTQQLADNTQPLSHPSERPLDVEAPVFKKTAEKTAEKTDDACQVEAPAKPPTPHELLNQWYERYPHAFFKGHTKPLKVGIHQDLADREPWSNKLIRRALANYVNLPRYVKAMREGAERIDLEGNVAGVVDPQAAEFAANKRKPKDSPDANSARDKKKQSEKMPSRQQAVRQKTSAAKSASGRKVVQQPKAHNPHVTRPPEAANQDSTLSLEEKLANLQAKFKAH